MLSSISLATSIPFGKIERCRSVYGWRGGLDVGQRAKVKGEVKGVGEGVGVGARCNVTRDAEQTVTWP